MYRPTVLRLVYIYCTEFKVPIIKNEKCIPNFHLYSISIELLCMYMKISYIFTNTTYFIYDFDLFKLYPFFSPLHMLNFLWGILRFLVQRPHGKTNQKIIIFYNEFLID